MEELVLYSRAFGVDAGGDQGERCASSVEIGWGVDVSSGVEKQRGDVYDVLRSLLAVVFDSVGCYIVQERGLVAAGGAGAD